MDLPLTPTEQQIEDAIKDHPQAMHLKSITSELQKLVFHICSMGAQQDIVAVAATTHLTSMLSAQKMSGVVDPELIDLLLDDLFDTVRNRAYVGETKLRTK